MNRISKNNIDATNWMDEINQVKEAEVAPLDAPVCVKKDVTEETINSECDRIDAMASEGSSDTYYVNGTWEEDQKSYLKEYAKACGIEEVKEASLEQIKATVDAQQKKASSQSMVKTASAEENMDNEMQDKLAAAMGDPFKLDEKLEDDRNIHGDWEQVTEAQVLADKPSTVGINAIRGGESTDINYVHQSGVNQNSILDPEKIDRLAESEVVDNGEMIRQQNAQARAESLAAQQADRDALLAKAEEELAITSAGNVFPTESLNAQSGIQGQMGGRLLDVEAVPEQTKGEMIKEMNADERSRIQRPKTEDRSWEKVDSSIRTISEDFGDELSKLLDK